MELILLNRLFLLPKMVSNNCNSSITIKFKIKQPEKYVTSSNCISNNVVHMAAAAQIKTMIKIG